MAKIINFTDLNKSRKAAIEDFETWNEFHNSVCIGYAILAAERAGFTPEQIEELVFKVFEVQCYEGKCTTPAQAEEAYMKWLDETQ